MNVDRKALARRLGLTENASEGQIAASLVAPQASSASGTRIPGGSISPSPSITSPYGQMFGSLDPTLLTPGQRAAMVDRGQLPEEMRFPPDSGIPMAAVVTPDDSLVTTTDPLRPVTNADFESLETTVPIPAVDGPLPFGGGVAPVHHLPGSLNPGGLPTFDPDLGQGQPIDL